VFFANQDEVSRLAQDMAKPAVPPSQATEPPTGAPGDSSAPWRGTVLRYFGDYELLDEIARGGMGVVYKARQASLNRLVALKMILAGQLAGSDDVRRFHTEAEAAANLDHPNILPIYDAGEPEGQHYLSMRWIEGKSLAAALGAARDGATSEYAAPKAAAKLIATVARAVHHAHQRGIIHRDLKPGNVLLDEQGEPHVTDFGLAKRVEGDSKLTRSGAIVGTPSYMAPEQARGEKGLSVAADVYSLGAILYELLTGRPPFQAATPLDTVLQVLEKEPISPRAISARIDPDLEPICLKCLQKVPGRRYPSSSELADDLSRFVKGEPILARPVGTRERVVKWVKRRPAVAALLALVILVTLAGLGGIAWAYGEVVDERNNTKTEADNARKAEADARKAEADAREQKQKADRAADAAKAQTQETLRALADSKFMLADAAWREGHVAQTRD